MLSESFENCMPILVCHAQRQVLLVLDVYDWMLLSYWDLCVCEHSIVYDYAMCFQGPVANR